MYVHSCVLNLHVLVEVYSFWPGRAISGVGGELGPLPKPKHGERTTRENEPKRQRVCMYVLRTNPLLEDLLQKFL